ncbi:uncharacterized protein G2W53_028340 [Senna tora]|uniref:Uncharacterized protein n=1 Tax=Senna tora TaxID=362788 RepID=A0A834WCS3_9FABA|nr:uncharacterized protein G2W53_028340 [Senna tora]
MALERLGWTNIWAISLRVGQIQPDPF